MKKKSGILVPPSPPPSPASASQRLNDVATDQRTCVTETLNNERITRKQHIFGSYNLITQLNQFSAILQIRITYFKRCHFSFSKVCFTYSKHMQIRTYIFFFFLGMAKKVLLFWGSYCQFLNSVKGI